MWMAALWDFASGNYAAGQDWNHKQSMWEVDLVMHAKLCLKGLKDMKNFKAQQRVSSVQHPRAAASPAELEDCMLVCMAAWCDRVSRGIMAHGPLLAHARQCGHDLVKTSCKQPDGSFCHFLVPKKRLQPWNQYDWQEHGRDGMDAITKFLKLNGFWTDCGMEVANVAPPMLAQSTKEKNLLLLSDIVPRAMWKDFHTPRGGEVVHPRRSVLGQLRVVHPRRHPRISGDLHPASCVQRHCDAGRHAGHVLPPEQGALVLGFLPA